MKFRVVFLFLILPVLAACNFSLAEDVTPPPGYVPPTPPPDLGILFPPAPASPARGAALFLDNCAPCHGEDGLGNGPMAASMPVAVPAIGLRAIASQSAPLDWYKVISLGNLERGMPPFFSHPSQERWDMLAYSYTLSTTVGELQRGADLFAAYCADCHGPNGSAAAVVDLTDQQFMSQITGTGLYRAIAEGKGTMQAFDGQLPEDDIWALVAYLRTLPFDMSALPDIVPEPTQTPVPDETTTPGNAPSVLRIDGIVSNASGTPLAAGLVATLSLYDTSTNQLVDTLTADVAADGSYLFTDVEADVQLAYWVSVDYQGVTYFSVVGFFDNTVSSMAFPVSVYDSTPDWSTLDLNLLHIVLDFSTPGIVKVDELYSLRNLGTQTVVVETDGTFLPFIQTPAGVTDLTLKPSSSSAPILPAEGGLALIPLRDGQYDVVASFTMPYDRRLDFSQNLALPVASLTLFVVDGTNIKGEQLTDSGTQVFNDTIYHLYQAANLPAGVLAFTATAPRGSQSSANADQRTGLILGVGALGVIFIGLGIFLFLRDRARSRQEELEEDGDSREDDPWGSDPDALADAIISLDEQLRNGEISREAHAQRRSELKERLKKAL